MTGTMTITVSGNSIGVSTRLDHVDIMDKMAIVHSVGKALHADDVFWTLFIAAVKSGLLGDNCIEVVIPHTKCTEGNDDC